MQTHYPDIDTLLDEIKSNSKMIDVVTPKEPSKNSLLQAIFSPKKKMYQDLHRFLSENSSDGIKIFEDQKALTVLKERVGHYLNLLRVKFHLYENSGFKLLHIGAHDCPRWLHEARYHQNFKCNGKPNTEPASLFYLSILYIPHDVQIDRLVAPMSLYQGYEELPTCQISKSCLAEQHQVTLPKGVYGFYESYDIDGKRQVVYFPLFMGVGLRQGNPFDIHNVISDYGVSYSDALNLTSGVEEIVKELYKTIHLGILDKISMRQLFQAVMWDTSLVKQLPQYKENIKELRHIFSVAKYDQPSESQRRFLSTAIYLYKYSFFSETLRRLVFQHFFDEIANQENKPIIKSILRCAQMDKINKVEVFNTLIYLNNHQIETIWHLCFLMFMQWESLHSMTHLFGLLPLSQYSKFGIITLEKYYVKQKQYMPFVLRQTCTEANWLTKKHKDSDNGKYPELWTDIHTYKGNAYLLTTQMPQTAQSLWQTIPEDIQHILMEHTNDDSFVQRYVNWFAKVLPAVIEKDNKELPLVKNWITTWTWFFGNTELQCDLAILAQLSNRHIKWFKQPMLHTFPSKMSYITNALSVGWCLQPLTNIQRRPMFQLFLNTHFLSLKPEQLPKNHAEMLLLFNLMYWDIHNHNPNVNKDIPANLTQYSKHNQIGKWLMRQIKLQTKTKTWLRLLIQWQYRNPIHQEMRDMLDLYHRCFGITIDNMTMNDLLNNVYTWTNHSANMMVAINQEVCRRRFGNDVNLIEHQDIEYMVMNKHNENWNILDYLFGKPNWLDVKTGITVTPLLTANELHHEGKNMQHCVGGYAHRVVTQDSFIFHLEDDTGQLKSTLDLRIEYRKDRESSQSRFIIFQHYSYRDSIPDDVLIQVGQSFCNVVNKQLVSKPIHLFQEQTQRSRHEMIQITTGDTLREEVIVDLIPTLIKQFGLKGFHCDTFD